MTEKSYFWDGLSTGHASYAPYNSAEFADFFEIITTPNPTKQGVVPGYLSELLPYSNGTSIAISDGAAFLRGRLYVNTATLSWSVTGGAATYGIVYLTLNATTQTIAAAHSSGYASITAALAAVTCASATACSIPIGAYKVAVNLSAETWYDLRNFAGIPAGMSLLQERTSDIGDGAPRYEYLYADFRNIPQYYRHLKIIGTCKSSDAATSQIITMTVNSDSSAHYSHFRGTFQNSGTPAAVNYTAGNADSSMQIYTTGDNVLSGYPVPFEIDIPYYRDNLEKSIVVKCTSLFANTVHRIDFSTFFWSQVDAINEIKLTFDPGTDWTYRISLYGIA